ncbi:MAG: hypothetical protein GWP04_00080 [Gammaproteobacteria bacterium]|nr:hypothetical protein [Gammaproteobacteria bacterium]
MRLRKLTILLLVVALVGAVLAVPAFAEEADGSGEAFVSGRGRLWARGAGEVRFDMGGQAHFFIDGDVMISDIAGDMKVKIISEDTYRNGGMAAAAEFVGRELTLEDFRGYLAVEGTHFLLQAEGKAKLRARGVGVAHLAGRGWYKTGSGPITRWSATGREVELAG